jgi:hypothetical protein
MEKLIDHSPLTLLSDNGVGVAEGPENFFFRTQLNMTLGLVHGSA